MAYKLDDYESENHSIDCELQGSRIELLLGEYDTPLCPRCNVVLNRCFPAPKGYVKGTTNPVTYVRGKNV